MRRLGVGLTAMLLVVCLAVSCGFSAPGTAASGTLELPQPAAGWQDSYLAFLDDCYDIFAALWPDGISGLGFIDLDLDGTPELVVFDQGASATMGVHLFDLSGDWVYCVSSELDSAAGAFTDEHMTDVSVCANYFESFRLSWTGSGWCFWVDSANGTMETAWDEFVRFDCEDGVLVPKSVCARYLESEPERGTVTAEAYTVAGQPVDKEQYQSVADSYQTAQDAGYEAKGVFRWNDMDAYDTSSYDGFMALAQAAVNAYVPITDTVTVASVAP